MCNKKVFENPSQPAVHSIILCLIYSYEISGSLAENLFLMSLTVAQQENPTIPCSLYVFTFYSFILRLIFSLYQGCSSHDVFLTFFVATNQRRRVFMMQSPLLSRSVESLNVHCPGKNYDLNSRALQLK